MISTVDSPPPAVIINLRYMSLSITATKAFVLSVVLFAAALIIFTLPSFAASRTGTVYNTTGDGVDVIPYVRSDQNALFVDFEHPNFNNIEYIYYNLNYDTDEPATKRGVEGSFIPSQKTPSGHFNGRPYFRHELLFGTCSKNVCKYDKGVRNVKLTVNTNYLTGAVDQYTKVLTFPQDQF